MNRSIAFLWLFFCINISNMALAGGVEKGQFINLDLKVSDVEVVAIETVDVEEGIWIKLAPIATDELKSITENNLGKQILITFEGIKAVRAASFAPLTSGVIRISSPSDELLVIIKKYIEENKIQEKIVN